MCSHGKVRLAGIGLQVCHKDVTGCYLRNSLGAEQFALAGMY